MVSEIITLLRTDREQARIERENEVLADLDRLAQELDAEDAHFARFGHYSWSKKTKNTPTPGNRSGKRSVHQPKAQRGVGKRYLGGTPHPKTRPRASNGQVAGAKRRGK